MRMYNEMIVNDFKVCVQETDGLVLSGRIYHCYAEEPLKFHGIMEMLLTIDALCQKLDTPLAEPERRTLGRSMKEQYGSPACYHSFKEFVSTEKDRFAFFLKIRYRRNVSWQGSVHFSGEARSYKFRSVLELIGYLAEKTLEIS